MDSVDIQFVDPDFALIFNPSFSQKGELEKLVETMKKTMLVQLCFILEEYTNWLKLEFRVSPLDLLCCKSKSNAWGYGESIEDTREEYETWIDDCVKEILL